MKEKILGIVDKVKENPKKAVAIALIVVASLFFIRGFANFRATQNMGENPIVDPVGSVDIDPNTQDFADLYDKEIITRQPDLVKKYGATQEGFLWDLDGTLVSLGDKDMSAEEVVYAYLNGIRTLDFSSAQKFSRGSAVVRRYSGFFDSSEARDDSYIDSFYRNMYTEVLKSIQIKGIKNTAVFADKQVFTIELEMLDLSSKDFWKPEMDDIYNTLYIYSRDEDDYTKSEQYVYDYVLGYYRSGGAVTKNVTINLTVEKYARLQTGWLVTIDKDVDDYCYYTDGNVVARYILSEFQETGRDYIREKRYNESKED